MAANSKIGWTDHSFNPWQGCEKVSPACDHCYAEALSIRVGKGARWGGPESVRDVTSDGYWRNPLKWDAAALIAGRPALVFCASLADVFEDRTDVIAARARLWDLIEATPNLIWLLLTKRPENVLAMVPPAWLKPSLYRYRSEAPEVAWPANAWVGTTVEDQERALERVPHLVKLPAPVKFLSCEPLLGPVDLEPWLFRPWHGKVPGQALNDGCPMDGAVEAIPNPGIDWVIVGGESGPGHRPLDLVSVRHLRWTCHSARIPFFFKQHGGLHPGSGGHLLDDQLHYNWPAAAGDRSDLQDAAAREASR